MPPPPEPDTGGFEMEGGATSETGAERYKSSVSEEAAAAGEEGAMGCSVCGFPMEPEWRVCPNCVTQYETKCGTCGRTLQPWWLICPWCETRRPLERSSR